MKDSYSMLKSIFLPLDPSDENLLAREYAVSLAVEFKSSIAAVTIIDEPTINQLEPAPLGASEFRERLLESRRKESQEVTAKLISEMKSLADKHGVPCNTSILHGSPDIELINESFKHDLIVIGKAGYFKFATQTESCETLESLVKNTPRPIIHVTENSIKNKEILILTDGSSVSARASQMFLNLGYDESKYDYTVLSVSSDLSKAEENCEVVSDFFEHHNKKVKKAPIHFEDHASIKILDEIKTRNPALVVLGAFGISGMKEFFLGSVTKKLLEKNKSPIFLYK
jgi:nucleotide-binding universal stress UspA family protein